MPRGAHQVLVGLLLDNGTPYPTLRMPDGGEWRLDIAGRYKPLLGLRVEVEGIRDGFDLMAVKKIRQHLGR